MSTYPRYDEAHTERANTMAPYDPFDNTSARVGFPAPETQSGHRPEYNPYSTPPDMKSPHDEGRSIYGDPSRTTLVAEEDHDPFAKQPAKGSTSDDTNESRPPSRRYEDLGEDLGDICAM